MLVTRAKLLTRTETLFTARANSATRKRLTAEGDRIDESLRKHYNDEAIAVFTTIPLKRNSTLITMFLRHDVAQARTVKCKYAC